MVLSTLFLSGAGGVLGGEIVRQCARLEKPPRVLCLIRAESEEHLRVRRADLLAYAGCDEQSPFAEHLVFLKGDVLAPFFGLGFSRYQSLQREVSHVVHAAAELRLNRPRVEAISDAMAAASAMTEFASKAGPQGRPARLLYVSTIGVAGGEMARVPELPLYGERTFRNSYEESKACVERVLCAKTAREVPVVIVRPSMIVGRAEDGVIRQDQVFRYLAEFCSGNLTYGVVPDFGPTTLDTIPVDTVAHIVLRALSLELPSGTVLHACAGKGGAISLSDLGALYRQYVGTSSKPRRRVLPVPRGLFSAAFPFLKRFLPKEHSRRLSVVPHLFPYLGARQEFDMSRTRELLREAGLEFPNPHQHLKKVLSYRSGA